METARFTTWSPCWSCSPRVRTSKSVMPEETSLCQKSVSGTMSGVGFWSLPINLAGGSVEYKLFNEAMAVAVNVLLHFSTPSNPAEAVCVAEQVETRRSTKPDKTRVDIENLDGIINKRDICGSCNALSRMHANPAVGSACCVRAGINRVSIIGGR